MERRGYFVLEAAAGLIAAAAKPPIRFEEIGQKSAVRITLPDGRSLFNQATTSVGYASSSEPLVRFGLGTNLAAQTIEIRWPNGAIQQLSDVAADRIVEVTEEAKP